MNNKKTNREDYIRVIECYLKKVDARYVDFQFKSRKKDLPAQMYFILRCGIVHKFSLVPGQEEIKNGGRPRSILLSHRKNGNTHFKEYTKNGMDSVVFTAEDFAEDLEKLVKLIFDVEVPKNPNLEKNIENWVSKFPPILGVFY